MDGFDPKLGPKQQTGMPTPNMRQATGMPKPTPSPMPSSGFAKQGMKPGMPKLMDEQ